MGETVTSPVLTRSSIPVGIRVSNGIPVRGKNLLKFYVEADSICNILHISHLLCTDIE